MHGQLRVAVGFFLLSACSGPVEPDLSEASRLHVSHLPPETCRLSFDGKAFDLRTQEREAIRSLRARSGSREAVIDFDVTVPWGCVGFGVAVAQRANYRVSIPTLPATPSSH